MLNTAYSQMQVTKPIKSYIKTIRAKVYVTMLDPFGVSKEPVGKILSGNPKDEKRNDGCIVDIYSEMEDMFFRRMNKRQFELGHLQEYTRPETPPEKSPNEITEEELSTILKMKFIAMQHKVNTFTSPAPLFRLLGLARSEDKSEKIIKFIEGKIAELQEKEYEVEEENFEEE